MFHVGITGASSFTGYWIAKVLTARGYRVSNLFSRPRDQYAGVRAERVHQASGESYFNLDASRGDLQNWIEEFRPDVWIHHHHWMHDFRSNKYDLNRARSIGVVPLPAIVEQLVSSGCKGVIFSGTYCEPGEGEGQSAIHSSPYALSKREVWDKLQELCVRQGLPLSKIVIPNPVGPLEDPERLTPSLLQAASVGKPFVVHAPQSMIDFIPIQCLASAYVESVRQLCKGKFGIRRPSGWTGTVGQWTEKVLTEVAYRRLRWPTAELSFGSEPVSEILRNPETEKVDCNWTAFWDDLAEDIRSRPGRDSRYHWD